jgi:hypothetical protein
MIKEELIKKITQKYGEEIEVRQIDAELLREKGRIFEHVGSLGMTCKERIFYILLESEKGVIKRKIPPEEEHLSNYAYAIPRYCREGASIIEFIQDENIDPGSVLGILKIWKELDTWGELKEDEGVVLYLPNEGFRSEIEKAKTT